MRYINYTLNSNDLRLQNIIKTKIKFLVVIEWSKIKREREKEREKKWDKKWTKLISI